MATGAARDVTIGLTIVVTLSEAVDNVVVVAMRVAVSKGVVMSVTTGVATRSAVGVAAVTV